SRGPSTLPRSRFAVARCRSGRTGIKLLELTFVEIKLTHYQNLCSRDMAMRDRLELFLGCCIHYHTFSSSRSFPSCDAPSRGKPRKRPRLFDAAFAQPRDRLCRTLAENKSLKIGSP